MKSNIISAMLSAVFVAVAMPFDKAQLDAITTSKYPDADTVIVDDHEKTLYNPDGTYSYVMDRYVKLLTEKGRRGQSSLTVGYSKRYGDAKIEYIGAIGVDGVEREIDVSATTKEATDNSAMSSNIYDPLDRKIKCTIPGLKVGDTLHIRWSRRETRARCEGTWADMSTLEERRPVMKAVCEVVAPKELPLKKLVIRHPLGNVVTNALTNADGTTSHIVTVTNSPQAFPEPSMPPFHTQVQSVRFSTAEDWPEISRWYAALCQPHIAKTNAAMIAKAKELKDVRAIFKFVSQEIRYMGLTMEDTSPGYAPHDVDITFNNRYGVCRDKAGLLVAMLRAAGFKAYPTLIHVGAKHDAEVPMPFFNHAIVAVEEKPRTYTLMDPTNENTRDLLPTYLCNRSYLVCRAEGETLMTTPVVPPEQNELSVESKGTLEKDGSVFLQSVVRMNGINDTVYRGELVKRTPEDRVKLFRDIVKNTIPGAELITCDVEPKDMRDTEKPIVVSFAAKLPEQVLEGESVDEMSIPMFSKALGVANFILSGDTALETRKYSLELPCTAKVREMIAIDCGSRFRNAAKLPEPLRIKGGYDYSFAVSFANSTLRAERSLAVSSVEFSPAEYLALREHIKEVEANERKSPAFQKDPDADTDLHYGLVSYETSISSDRSWVTTNRVEKKVLTYKGRKSSAELKFEYNPAWKKVEIIDAVVSNADGRVSHVTDKEINVMDAGWAASAPRYPAGKILVANLPGVEIGSTISYTVVTTVTNAPKSFYSCYGFDSKSPIDRKIVRVNDWRRDERNVKRLPKEPNQPWDVLWGDNVFISSNRFERMDLAITPVDLPVAVEGEGLKKIKNVHDWMVKHVKIAGPGLYSLPLSLQLTVPKTVLAERYGTRLDFIRTLCAALKGCGFEADVVFAASDATWPAWYRQQVKYGKPDVGEFDDALCRVNYEGRAYFLGTENEYAELGTSAYEGCSFYDPAFGTFGEVTLPEKRFSDRSDTRCVYMLRENGTVDFEYEKLTYGSSNVAAFRRLYAEMLPEDRSRHHQKLLGAVAQSASATGELVTDTASYPARMAFSCYVPDMATVSEDRMTITLPGFESSIPSFSGKCRKTPFEVGAVNPESETAVVRFPKGYTKIEHLPEAFVFCNPLNPDEKWMEAKVSHTVKDGGLEVVITRTIYKRNMETLGREYAELIVDWGRIADSRANRTLSVARR